MSSEKTLIVKLTDQTPSTEGPGLIRAILCEQDVEQVEPLFPGDPEPDLATLFNVTLGRSASPNRAIDALKRDAHIQYAHTHQERTLR